MKITRKEIKLTAKQKLMKDPWPIIGMVCIPLMAIVGFDQTLFYMSDTIFTSIITMVVQTVVVFGITRVCMNMMHDEKLSWSDLLYGLYHLKSVLVLGIVIILKTILWLCIPTVIFVALSTMSFMSMIQDVSSASIILGIVLFLSMLLYMCVIIFVTIRYMFASYILIHDPSKRIKVCIQEGKELVKGKYVQMFLFEWSFFWWLLLGVATLGIGLLFTIPYMMLSYVGVYDALVQEQTKKKTIEV